MITITAKQDGFRRAGMAHSATPKDYPDGHFTSKQLDALRAEPMLVVVERPDEAAPEAEPGKKGKSGKSSKSGDNEGAPPDPDAAPGQDDSQK